MTPRPVPDLIGICWDSEEHIWFEVDQVGELCPEDDTGSCDVTYYRKIERAVSDDEEQP